MHKSPRRFNESNRIGGCVLVGKHTFRIGVEVPLFDISSFSAFNQIVGYAKYLNKDFGNVYYRGINGLYDNVMPSLMRGRTRGIAQDLKNLIGAIQEDEYLKNSLHLLPMLIPTKNNKSIYSQNNHRKRINKYLIEGLLQHYAGKTRFIDVVDNHWIALWMGLHDFIECGEGHEFISCRKRTVNISTVLDAVLNGVDLQSEDFKQNIYEYILLLAMPYPAKTSQGVYENGDWVEVDLRKALPSTFLRPHAQHAMVIRKRDIEENAYDANYYDMASQVIGILRIRTDLADKWLGYGELLSKDNLFPSPSLDQGYNNLLKNSLFNPNFKIKKYF